MCMESRTRNCDGTPKASRTTTATQHINRNTSRPTGARSVTTNGTPKVKVSFGNRNR